MNQCVYCESVFRDNVQVKTRYSKTLDHFIPISRWGSNYAVNRVECCGQCNMMKGSYLPHEFIAFLTDKINNNLQGGYKGYNIATLQKMVTNTERLIFELEPYTNKLYKTYWVNTRKTKSPKMMKKKVLIPL